MSTWSDGAVRGTVLRGGAAAVARPARMDSELRSTPYAPGHVTDARLTDPHLQDVVERARTAAVDSGRTEGFAEGYATGLATAAEQAAAAAARQQAQDLAAERLRDAALQHALEVLGHISRTMQGREAVALADVEDVVVELAVRVAEAVLAREVRSCDDPGREALARALVLAPEGAPAVARLHPDDAAALTGLEALAAGREVVVVADPGITRGGCVVDAAGRHVDAQVESALHRVAQALR